MKYIKSKIEYLSQEPINEEFIGGLLKGLFKHVKSQVAMNISKKIGSIGEVDKLLASYKSTLVNLMQPKVDALKEITEMEGAIENGGEGTLEELKKLVAKYSAVVNNVDAQIKNAKGKFDVQVGMINKKEKNPLINDYITLKKFDMTQEFLQMELNIINDGSGLSPEQVANSETLKKLNKDLVEKAKKIASEKEAMEKSVGEKSTEDNTSVKSATPTEFDEEAAKNDKTYVWNSIFSNGEYAFTKGEAIKYWSNGQEEVKDAFVVDPEEAKLSKKVKENEIIINTVKGKTSGSFPILKGKVVSTEKHDKVKESEPEVKDEEPVDGSNDKDSTI